MDIKLFLETQITEFKNSWSSLKILGTGGGKMGNTYFDKFILFWLITLFSFCFLAPSCSLLPKRTVPSIIRISPKETRAEVKSGKALLVCSYDDLRCKDLLLEGAILRSDFEKKLGNLSRNKEIIFYCG